MSPSSVDNSGSGAGRDAVPEPITCPGCEGATFTVERCQCWYGGGAFEVDPNQWAAPDASRRAYPDCELCGGDGAVSAPCTTCDGLGSARPQVVLTVLNTDTARAASTMLVPGGLDAPRMTPTGAWVVDLEPVIAELAGRVGAGSVHDAFMGDDYLTRQVDGAYVEAGPEPWSPWRMGLPEAWYPDLPPADLVALEAQALVHFGARERWRVWRAGSRPALAPVDPDDRLSALCALATDLRMDLSIERRRDEPAVTGSPPGFSWDVRFELPDSPLPKSLPLPYAYLDSLAAVLPKLDVDAMLSRLAHDPSTAVGHWVNTVPERVKRNPGSVADLGSELTRLGDAAAGAVATWRNQRWHLSPLTAIGTTEDLHEQATGQVSSRRRTVVARAEAPPPPDWTTGHIPETACATCASGTAWLTCGCTLFGISGTQDSDCPSCHGAGVYASTRCSDCGDVRAIRHGAVVTVTDGYRAVHLNWTPHHQPSEIKVVGTQSDGAPIARLAPRYSAATLAAMIGTTRARLIDIQRGVPIDSPLLNDQRRPRYLGGEVGVRHGLADATADYVTSASWGWPGARIILRATPPPAMTAARLVAVCLAAGSEVAIIQRNHHFNTANPTAPQGEEWAVKILAPGQPPAELAGVAGAHRTLADAIADADERLPSDLEALARTAGPTGLLATPQQAVPLNVEVDDLPAQLHRVAEHYAGSRSEVIVARFSRAGCQLLLETRPQHDHEGAVIVLEGAGLGVLAEAPTLAEAVALLPLNDQQPPNPEPTWAATSGPAQAGRAPGVRIRNRGVIVAGGDEHQLESGDDDQYYALAIMRLRELGLVGPHAVPEIAAHVETKVAMWMHEQQANDVKLTLDNQPCIGPLSCETVLSGQLPPLPAAPARSAGGHLLAAYWRPEHVDQPPVATTRVELDRLLDELAREPFEYSVAALYIATRLPNEVGLPDHELRIAIDAEAGLGALRYMDPAGAWFSHGNTPSEHAIPCYSYMGSEALYPRHAHLPLPTICEAVHDFLHRGGDRPGNITWQALTP